MRGPMNVKPFKTQRLPHKPPNLISKTANYKQNIFMVSSDS